MPRFSANLSFLFTERPFEARFAAAAQAGFEGVEFLFPYGFDAGKLAAALEENALGLSVFNLPPGDWDAGERGLAALPGREAEFAESVERAVLYAEALGAARVHCMAGIAEGAEARALFKGNVQRAADRLGRLGCKLMIEPISAAAMPGYFLNRTDQALELLEEMAHPNIGLQWDVFHHTLAHGEPCAALPDVTARLAHVQIAGVPERQEPLGMSAIFAALDAAGYAGWIGCEYHPKGTTEEGLDWLKEARDASAET